MKINTARIIGTLIIIANFIPLEYLFGEIKGFSFPITPYLWFLSITITFTLAWLFNSLAPNLSNKFVYLLLPICNGIIKITYKWYFVILPIILFLVSHFAYSHRPLLIDTIVQTFQAEIFSFGRLKAINPKHIEFFVTQHMIFDDQGWYGQYPPGHSLLLVPGVLLGLHWFIPIFLSTLTLYVIKKFVVNIYGEAVARITVILFLISPFFIFMSASEMNHVSSLLCIGIGLYNLERWEKLNHKKYLFFSTFAISYGLLVRPLDVIAVSTALLPFILNKIIKNYINLLIVFFGSFPIILLGLLYNLKTTGDPFLPGYIKLWGTGHGLGFHQSPWGKDHTPLTGLRNELVDNQLLNEMLYEWSLPSLSLIGFYLIFNESFMHEWSKRLLAIAISFPCLYFFYWHRDAFLGPRFMYESIIAWIPLTAMAIHEIIKYYNSKTVRFFGILSKFQLKNYIYSVLGFTVLFALLVNIPQRYRSYETSLASMKVDIVQKAKEKDISSGLIFVKSSWGVRIMSQLRGLGVDASLTQIAYSYADHCKLDEITKNAIKDHLTPQEVINQVRILLDQGERGYTYRANFDPSLKLNKAGIISETCRDEINYDLKNGEQHYTIYEPHMRSNTPLLDGNFIIAKDLRSRNEVLKAEYPNLTSYIFDGVNFIKQ